jgi:BMFP domain-containing protein YqiC
MRKRLDEIHKQVIHDMPKEIQRDAARIKKNVDQTFKRVISFSSL